VSGEATPDLKSVTSVEMRVIRWDDRGRGLVREAAYEFFDGGGNLVLRKTVEWSASQVRSVEFARNLRKEICRDLGIDD